VNYGDKILTVTSDRSICLVGANLSVRRTAFDAVGLFATELQRVRDGIGSLEDHDFQLRFYRLGRFGVYDPRIVIHAEVEPNRLDRAYHRRWHTGHGHFHALLRAEYMEQSRAGSLWGVPAHLYRQAVLDAAAWARACAQRDAVEAFRRELRLRFFKGFWRTRKRQFKATPAASLRKELTALPRRIFHRERPVAGPVQEAHR
jgi:hypothetical protein